VRNVLSCYDLEGTLLWRKEAASGAWPKFFASSSPIVVDGACIVQLGGDREGSITAYDLNMGDEKWKWTGDGAAYASPVVAKLNGAKAIVAVTASKLVAVNAADGKELWKTDYNQGRYNATTPIATDSTVIYAGPTTGITAVKLEKEGDELTAKDKHKIADATLFFNTPVLRDGWLFGISNLNSLFSANAETGEVAWSAPMGEQQPSGAAQGGQPGGGPPGGGRGRGGMRGGMGGGGYGSVVDAGSVLIALSPVGQLVVFEPNEKEYKEIAKYKVAEGDTYAYPVVSGNRIYVKDKDSVALWTIE
jgi:outer membrane protein assembly factor BamB